MERKTSSVILTRTQLDAFLGALGGSVPGAAIFTGCKVKLFEGATVPTPDSVVGDFTETTAVGYTAQTVAAWSGPTNNPGDRRGWAAEPIFIFGDNRPNGVAITGYYLTNSAGSTLLAAERFASAVNVVDPGDGLLLDLFLMLPNAWASGV